MQDKLKRKLPLFELVPVPYEALVETEIDVGAPLQFTVCGGRITMEQAPSENIDFVCDDDCDERPMQRNDCSGDCNGCPCNMNCDESEVINLKQMFRILGKRGRITIPFEIRQRVGFSYNDVLSFTEAPDGRTVIVKREKICDNCAAEKPHKKEAEDTITLFDFLNGLSDEQQKAAFAHLKLKWDRLQGSDLYDRS